MKKITLAQLGAGYWGPNLIRNCVQLDAVERLVVCDTDEGRLRKIAQQYNGKIRTTTDSAAIFNDPAVDGVIVALPAAMHYDYCKKTLQAGKHVFVEKPLAMTEKDARDLVALAAKAGKQIMVGHTFLYNDAVRKVKSYIQDGTLGDIYYVFSQRLNLGRVRDDVNVVWNLAPHDISIILYWFGEEPSHVQAKGLSFLQKGIDDVAFVNLDFPSGRSAHIHVSWLDPSKTRKMVIVGSRKMLVYDDVASDDKIILYDKGIDKKHIVRDLPDIESFGQFQLLQRTGDVTIPYVPFAEPLKTECQHFVDCIRENKTPMTDGAHGVQVVSVLEKIDRAMKK